MTSPSEFSWGAGLSSPIVGPDGSSPGHPEATPHDQHRAAFLTDSANPNALVEDVFNKDVTQGYTDETTGLFVPGTLRPDVTAPVKESGPPARSGQFYPVDPSKFNRIPGRGDHDPEGMQDGEGKAWRDSVPPNPVI